MSRALRLDAFEDQGEFVFYVHEEPILTVKFRWKEPEGYRSRIILSMAGQTTTAIFKADVDARGLWKSARRTSDDRTTTVTRSARRAAVKFPDRSLAVDLAPQAILYEQDSPALLASFIRRYDAAQRGKQVFAAFAFPSAMAHVHLELRSSEARVIGGVELEFRRFHSNLAGFEAWIWADARDRICLVDAPSYHFAFVRRGYESLRGAVESDVRLSKPVWPVRIRRNIRVPMRDGVRLATDLYQPQGRGLFPVILIRTPYKKEMEELKALYYARRGYIVAVQDVRGIFSSPGRWEPYLHESRDGYDAVEFFGKYRRSNGKLGMIGPSYLAWTQWWAAVEQPQYLTTIVPNVSPPDPYEIHHQQGVFFLAPAIAWVDIIESGAAGDISGAALERVLRKRYDKLLSRLPVIECDQEVIGKPVPYWRDWVRHPANDAYWRQSAFSHLLPRVRIPVFHQSGWFDYDGIGTRLNYGRLVASGNRRQKLIIGPWGHTDQAHRRVGQLDFGPQALVDLQTAYLRWFDYWLKGIDNGIMREPLVDLFVLGSNQWIHSDVYPLPGTRYDKWYLAQGQRLTRHAPTESAGRDRYVYDPGDVAPSQEFACPVDVAAQNGRWPAPSNRDLRVRRDILVYESKPFARAYTLIGPFSAVLYASTSARDTDWHVRLIEVSGAGGSLQLAHGAVRARFRKSSSAPCLLDPGKVYRYDLDLCHCAVTVSAGSRLRLEIASAVFPICSRNLNTGGANELETTYTKASQAVYRSRRYPSHLLLPAIPRFEGSRPVTLTRKET